MARMMVRRIGGGVQLGGPRSGGRGVGLPSGVVANTSSLTRGRSLEASGVSSGGSREESPEEGRTGKLDQLYSIRC